jgi:hypothetical protein
VFHNRSKYINVRFYFIRVCIASKEIEVDYIKILNKSLIFLQNPSKLKGFYTLEKLWDLLEVKFRGVLRIKFEISRKIREDTSIMWVHWLTNSKLNLTSCIMSCHSILFIAFMKGLDIYISINRSISKKLREEMKIHVIETCCILL